MNGASTAPMSCAHDEIGDVVELGRLAIDDDEPRAVALGHQRKAGRRPDHQRRADGEEEIAGERQLLGAAHGGLRHGLAERDGRGLDVAAAVRAIGRAAAGGVEIARCTQASS